MNPKFSNGGAYCRSARLIGNTAVTAGGSGDATQVDSAWIDRLPADCGPFHSAKIIISYTATLAAAATLAFAAQFRDATDGSGTGAANYLAAIGSTVVATGPTGGGTVTGTVELDVDLVAAREFFQARITPDLSAANTDTAAFSVVAVLFGGREQPLTRAIATRTPAV